MIDRYLLRYFLAVVDCGNFSKAAKQMNVAQPTLSVGIGKLERLLGASLFQRTNKRVSLTDAGSRLSLHARRIEAEFNLAETAVLDMKPARVMRLGVLSSMPMTPVAAAIRLAQRDARSERVQIITGNERELLLRLHRGQIETALTIVRPGAERLASEPLFSERYALAMHSRHRLAGKTTIAAEELAEETMIVRRHCEVLTETSRHFTERGVRPFFAFRSTSDDQVLTLVRAGLGITVMPQCYVAKGVVRPALKDFDLKREIGLLYAGHAHHLQQMPPAIVKVIRVRYGGG